MEPQIGVKIRFPSASLTIFHAYLPPASPPSPADLDFINEYRGPSLFIGDFNAHAPELSFCDNTNETGRILCDFIASSCFSILNDDSPTHSCFAHGNPYRIDLALGNARFLPFFQDFSIGEDIGSDHVPIIVKCNFSHLPPSVPSNPRFDFRNADWCAFQDIVETLLPDSLPMDAIPQLNEAVTIVTESIYIAQEVTIPKISISHKPYSLSEEVLYTIKRRRKLRRTYFRSKDPALIPLINRLNHEIKALLKNENEAYWCKFCEQINTEEDPANFWKLFKRIGNPRNNQSKPIKYEGKTHCSDDSKASVLAATLLEAMTEPPSSLGPIPLKESLDLQSKITNFSLSKPSLLPESLSPDQEALLNEITI
jgi:hypothetical protein